jgi:DNA repair protein RadA/Sms
VYAATVGGAALKGPAADLAIAVALAGAALNRVVPAGTVAIGEVGLAGELRRVPSLAQRLAEAARLGFRYAVVPADRGPAATDLPPIDGMQVVECADLDRALRVLRVISDVARKPGAELHVVR